MAQHKSFTTYAPTDGATFQINGRTFNLRPAVPGDVLLDFMASLSAEDASKTAGALRELMQLALAEGQYPAWESFIRDPANNVTLNVLVDIAGFVAECLSGNPTADQSPAAFMGG